MSLGSSRRTNDEASNSPILSSVAGGGGGEDACPWPAFADKGATSASNGRQASSALRESGRNSSRVSSLGDRDISCHNFTALLDQAQEIANMEGVNHFPDEIVLAAIEPSAVAAPANAKGVTVDDAVPVLAPPWWKIDINFYRVLVFYLSTLALISAAVVHRLSPNVPFVDCLYICVSCVCGCGLFTVSILDIQSPALGVLYFLFFAGLHVTIQWLVYLYKRHMFGRIRSELFKLVGNKMKEFEAGKLELPGRPEEEELLRVIARKSMQQRGEAMAALAMFIHVFFHLCIGSFIFYGIAEVFYPEGNYPDAPDVVRPGVSRSFWSTFLLISAYCQAGLSPTANNIIGLADKPGLYLYLTVPILFGNTMAPISFRVILMLLQRFCKRLRLDEEGIEYALRRPRMVSFMLFDNRQTIMLALILLLMNMVEWFTFLASTITSTEAQAIGNHDTIAGLGWFETVSTRAAGLQIMDFHYVNHGMLVIWAIMMYISSAPLVSRMYVSEQTEQTLKDKGPLRKAVTTRGAASEVVKDFQDNYLFNHIGWIAVAFVTLCFSENELLVRYPEEVNIFTVAWEIISAYGGVGTSMGFRDLQTASGFTILGKVMIMLTMGMGKMRGMPINTDIAIDFSYQTITNALRNYAVAMMVHNYEHQRIDSGLTNHYVDSSGSVQPPTAAGRRGDGVSSPTSQSVASSFTLDHHHTLAQQTSYPVSPTMTAQRANNASKPGHYTLHRSDHLEGFPSRRSSHDGNSSVVTTAKVIDPTECPLLYNMIISSLGDAVLEKRLAVGGGASRPPSHGSKPVSRAASRAPSMDLHRTSIEGSRPRISMDCTAPPQVPPVSPSVEAEPCSGTMPTERQSGLKVAVASPSPAIPSQQAQQEDEGRPCRSAQEDADANATTRGRFDSSATNESAPDAPPSLVRNISSALGNLFAQRTLPFKETLTGIADTAKAVIAHAVLEPADAETVEEELKLAQLPVADLGAALSTSNPTSGLSPNLLALVGGALAPTITSTAPVSAPEGVVAPTTPKTEPVPAAIESTPSSSSKISVSPLALPVSASPNTHPGAPSPLRDRIGDLPDHPGHHELDPVTEERPEDARWSMDKPFPTRYLTLKTSSSLEAMSQLLEESEAQAESADELLRNWDIDLERNRPLLERGGPDPPMDLRSDGDLDLLVGKGQEGSGTDGVRHGHALDVGGVQQLDGHDAGARAMQETSNAAMSVNLDDVAIGIFARVYSTGDSVQDEGGDTPRPAVIEVRSETNGVGRPNQATGGEGRE